MIEFTFYCCYEHVHTKMINKKNSCSETRAKRAIHDNEIESHEINFAPSPT